jgi:L-amino acid N-acyltransferase YncA
MSTDRHIEHSAIGIRDATDADLPSILAIVNEQIAHSPYIWAEAAKTLDERRAWLDAHRASNLPALVAESDGTVVAWASLSTFRSASGYRFTAEVSVYVDPRWQRQGHAARLVHELEDRARGLELHALLAVIDAENAASVRLFMNRGYSEVGRFPEVGRKFGQWRSEVFLLKTMSARSPEWP